MLGGIWHSRAFSGVPVPPRRFTCAALLAAACGGGSSGGGTNPNTPVASVTVAPATDTLVVSASVQLTATPKDASGNALSGRTVTWVSSDTTVATVSASGLVTGKVAGTATITATSEGQSGTSAITVVHVPVASVSVTPATPSVNEGK